MVDLIPKILNRIYDLTKNIEIEKKGNFLYSILENTRFGKLNISEEGTIYCTELSPITLIQYLCRSGISLKRRNDDIFEICHALNIEAPENITIEHTFVYFGRHLRRSDNLNDWNFYDRYFNGTRFNYDEFINKYKLKNISILDQTKILYYLNSDLYVAICKSNIPVLERFDLLTREEYFKMSKEEIFRKIYSSISENEKKPIAHEFIFDGKIIRYNFVTGDFSSHDIDDNWIKQNLYKIKETYSCLKQI